MSTRSIAWPKIELVPIGDLRPSTYNPREADPDRLELVSLSIRKLGFLLPVYADANGELLSGHQRHYIATKLGFTKLPVVRLPVVEDLNRRKALNLLFNRATNDMLQADTSKSLTEKLQRFAGTLDAAATWPDVDLNSTEAMPCIGASMQLITPFLKANSGRWDSYLSMNAGALHNCGAFVPIVATPDHQVVNGLGRLQFSAENGEKTIQVVMLKEQQATLAKAMLNCLTMDFAVHNRYADLLRHNSFRRAFHTKNSLGLAFILDAFGLNATAGSIDMSDAETARKWKRHYGTSVLDFGAGHLDDTERLRKIGVGCVPFEPYQTTGIDIDKPKSRIYLLEFLKAVRDGVRFDSIFQNSIMNSVPFIQDRQHIVRLISVLCTPNTAVHACAASTNYRDYKTVRGETKVSGETLQFQLGYEDHTIVSELHKQPKIQKYHTPAEWFDLWSVGFERVKASYAEGGLLVYARCTKPKSLSPSEIRKAIEFEFDLPYPDGSRMGLVTEALATFSARLKTDLAST